MEEEIKQKLEDLTAWTHYYNKEIKQHFEESTTIFANMQLMLNTMTQIVSSQVNVLNQVSQQMNLLTLKLTDMEVKNQDSESSLSELVENSNNIATSIEQLKTNVENMRQAAFYSYD